MYLEFNASWYRQYWPFQVATHLPMYMIIEFYSIASVGLLVQTVE
jgi:hypothetical protein